MENANRRIAGFLAALGLLLATTTAVQAAPTAQQKCRAAKNKAAGLYSLCRQKAERARVLTGNTAKYDEAIAKCETNFAAQWQKAIDNATAAAATCADSPLTATDFKGRIDDHSDEVAAALAGGGLTPCKQYAPCTAGDYPILDESTTRYLLHPATGHCYVAVVESADWHNAEAFCAIAGGHLAVPSDFFENRDFLAEVRATAVNTWIGIQDLASEGDFFSQTGEPFDTQWAGGEPNNAGDEDCVVMYGNNTWADFPCSWLQPQFICEFAP